jgi:hypothetical protein
MGHALSLVHGLLSALCQNATQNYASGLRAEAGLLALNYFSKFLI